MDPQVLFLLLQNLNKPGDQVVSLPYLPDMIVGGCALKDVH